MKHPMAFVPARPNPKFTPCRFGPTCKKVGCLFLHPKVTLFAYTILESSFKMFSVQKGKTWTNPNLKNVNSPEEPEASSAHVDNDAPIDKEISIKKATDVEVTTEEITAEEVTPTKPNIIHNEVQTVT